MTLINPTPRHGVAIPAKAGIGLRSAHVAEVLETRPDVGWFEVHSENYFGKGGAPLRQLERVRADYPISLHGVGLSLGSVDPLNTRHLQQLRDLAARIEPGLISEHLCWSSFGGVYLNDLLPLPYTEATLQHVTERVLRTQDVLGRQILIENPSSYLQFDFSDYGEAQFLNELARRSGCAILLDVNNVYVSCVNHGWDAQAYLRALEGAPIAEMHLAGHSVNRVDGQAMLIDTHNAPVCEAVWALYRSACSRFGCTPSLIEWDADLPPLPTLLAEAARADAVRECEYEQAA